MRTALVTGGAGFVGSHCALALKRDFANLRVVALDNLRRRGSELNLSRLAAGGVEFRHGDVRNVQDLDEVGPFDWIIECSAEPSVAAGYNTSPGYVVGANLVGLLNCIERARLYGSGIIFLSTSRVYPISALNQLKTRETDTRFELVDQQVSGASALGVDESFTLSGPRSIYGATKLAGELMLQEYVDAFGLKGVINRCGVIAGPWQMGKVDQGFVALWVVRHLLGIPLQYIGHGGTGKQVRDVLHVDDLVVLVEKQISSIDRVSGQVFNVGGSPAVSLSLAELTTLCRSATGRSVPITPISETPRTDVQVYLSNISKVTQMLGWLPTKSPADIVVDVAAWAAKHRGSLEAVLA